MKGYFLNYRFNSLFFRNLSLLLILIIVPLTGAIIISYHAYRNMQLKDKIRTIQELIKMPVLSKDYVDSVWVYSLRSGRVITQQGVAAYQGFRGQGKIEEYLNQEGIKALGMHSLTIQAYTHNAKTVSMKWENLSSINANKCRCLYRPAWSEDCRGCAREKRLPTE